MWSTTADTSSYYWEIKNHVYAKWESKFVSRDLIVAFCLLLRLLNNKLFHTSFIRKNCPGQFLGAFHLVKISGIFGSAVNGTRFVGSSHWKIPRKSGKSKKVVPFSRLEFPSGMSCSIYVSRSLYQFQVHGRETPRTGVYDQMEQLFTNRKFLFCYLLLLLLSGFFS